MSASPFLSSGPGDTQPGRQRRWRGRALIAVIAIAMLLAGAALAVSASGGGSRHPGARSRHRTAIAHVRTVAPARSATGLPLGAPALHLTCLGDPGADPVKLHFHHPPRAGLLFNLSNGRVLWQLEPERRRRIASLTKMMTALITVQSEPPHAHVLVTKQAVDAEGSKVGVLPLHRHVELESMLYGLLLPSGNDAAIALAQRVAGTVPAFVKRMNAEAARLGLGCTRYSSPSGIYDQGNFSCAADLAVLARDDLAQPRIARVTQTLSAVLPFPIKGGKLYLSNNNPLLIYGYPGTTGLKTGYTEAAGRCLVATAERDGVRLGVVVLDSNAPGVQARKLLDHAFRDVYHLRPVPEPPMPADA